jgi:hypothetical protein
LVDPIVQDGLREVQAQPVLRETTGRPQGQTQLVWFDRSGHRTGSIGEADDSQLSLEQLSADGGTAAVTRTIAGNTNVWLFDMVHGSFSFEVDRFPAVVRPG